MWEQNDSYKGMPLPLNRNITETFEFFQALDNFTRTFAFRKGDEVLMLAVDKDGAQSLLESYRIPYVLCARGTGKNVLEKGWLFARLCVEYSARALRFRPCAIRRC